jgi:hypothetical protein
VASLEPWQWPDAFDGVDVSDARKVRSAIDACNPPPRESAQAADWGGRIVADVLGLDADEEADKNRIKTMIKQWVKIGVLKIEKRQMPRKVNPVPFLVAGPNTLSEAQ